MSRPDLPSTSARHPRSSLALAFLRLESGRSARVRCGSVLKRCTSHPDAGGSQSTVQFLALADGLPPTVVLKSIMATKDFNEELFAYKRLLAADIRGFGGFVPDLLDYDETEQQLLLNYCGEPLPLAVAAAPLHTSRGLDVLIQLLLAAQTVSWFAGLVHRDLHPNNIFLQSHPRIRRELYICDVRFSFSLLSPHSPIPPRTAGTRTGLSLPGIAIAPRLSVTSLSSVICMAAPLSLVLPRVVLAAPGEGRPSSRRTQAPSPHS